jgi:hypothetical protein
MSNNKKFKSIEDWFKDDLEEPYKSKAIKYTEHYGMSNKLVPCLYQALKQGFIWQYTQENIDYPGYWNSLAQRILINQERLINKETNLNEKDTRRTN